MSELHTLVNARGATATIAPFGATIVELRVPDREGRLGNVVLGLDDPAGYPHQSFFLGAICGRVSNRIRDARFTLGGVTYRLEANDPPHHCTAAAGAGTAPTGPSRAGSAKGSSLALTTTRPKGTPAIRAPSTRARSTHSPRTTSCASR